MSLHRFGQAAATPLATLVLADLPGAPSQRLSGVFGDRRQLRQLLGRPVRQRPSACQVRCPRRLRFDLRWSPVNTHHNAAAISATTATSTVPKTQTTPKTTASPAPQPESAPANAAAAALRARTF